LDVKQHNGVQEGVASKKKNSLCLKGHSSRRVRQGFFTVASLQEGNKMLNTLFTARTTKGERYPPIIGN